MNYDEQIQQSANEVLTIMQQRVTAAEVEKIREAYEFAREAHKLQFRKSGEPYIIHPVAVARIVAAELRLGANPVMAAFLHDVVEDTEYTIQDIEQRFGKDVAFLVDVVTKKKKEHYHDSKQVDNYKQLLDSFHYDIRALLVKIADRLHNMRTLDSMRPDKQMKIAGETDYFYAPLANRLGLFDVKTDLENLAFRFRCPKEYQDIEDAITCYGREHKQRLDHFIQTAQQILDANGIKGVVEVYYRRPYSMWRKMRSAHCDFRHVENKYYIRVTFEYPGEGSNEKSECLHIYELLTNRFKERPQTFQNLIDQAKENSYQSINVMLLSDAGIWEDVQICSRRMVESSKLGCIAERNESNVAEWMERFKLVLKDIAKQETVEGKSFIENVVSSLYYDDVTVFSPDGQSFILPKGSTALDYAFLIDIEMGMHAKFARINGHLSSVKTELRRGDCVFIGTDPAINPKPDWRDHVVTYKAKKQVNQYLKTLEQTEICRCPYCKPIPGGDTIGFRGANGRITVHRKNCTDLIRQASKQGDSIVNVDYLPQEKMVFPVTLHLTGVDRYHILVDIIDYITNKMGLSIDNLQIATKDEIFDCTITFYVHELMDLIRALTELYTIPGVESVCQVE